MQNLLLPLILFSIHTSSAVLFAFQSDSSTPFVARASAAVVAAAASRRHRMLGIGLMRPKSNDQIRLPPLELSLPRQDYEELIDIDIPLSFEIENIEEYHVVEDEEDATVIMDDEVVVVVGTTNTKKNLIECSASILLPFSEDVAFDAFSDLTRQPSWCKYLHSVEYIGFVDGEDENDGNLPLRQSRWTIGVKGLRFSWTANDTRIVRPNHIEWESTSGLKNMGSVTFRSYASSSTEIITTKMTICFTFVAPRVVSSLFRRSGKLREYTEEVLLGNMLADFRDCLSKELEETNSIIPSPRRPHNQNPT